MSRDGQKNSEEIGLFLEKSEKVAQAIGALLAAYLRTKLFKSGNFLKYDTPDWLQKKGFVRLARITHTLSKGYYDYAKKYLTRVKLGRQAVGVVQVKIRAELEGIVKMLLHESGASVDPQEKSKLMRELKQVQISTLNSIELVRQECSNLQRDLGFLEDV